MLNAKVWFNGLVESHPNQDFVVFLFRSFADVEHHPENYAGVMQHSADGSGCGCGWDAFKYGRIVRRFEPTLREDGRWQYVAVVEPDPDARDDD